VKLRPAVEHKPFTNGRPTQQVYLCKTCGDGFIDDGSPTAGPGGKHGPGLCGVAILRFRREDQDAFFQCLAEGTFTTSH